jgi:hypothetical protein
LKAEIDFLKVSIFPMLPMEMKRCEPLIITYQICATHHDLCLTVSINRSYFESVKLACYCVDIELFLQ